MENLKVFMHNHDQNEYIYKLAFISKDELTKLKTEIEGNKDIIRVFNLGNTPLANSYSNKNVSNKLKKYPLGLNLCNGCGHLQLSHSIKPEKMFSNYLYKTNTSHKNFLHF